MLVSVHHKTTYSFAEPVHYALQKLRLVPRDTPQQRVLDWKVTVENGTREVSYFDHHGNVTELISTDADATTLTISVNGRVETRDTAGIFGEEKSAMPLWLYKRQTELTEPGERIAALSRTLDGASDHLEALHKLSAAIRSEVTYGTGSTYADTPAEAAMMGGKGVCQDHAQIFISATRAVGMPARYVSGYLLMDDRVEQDASHAWAEAYVDHLGWVGFDVSNGYSPDERYVRVAIGSDYRDAAPISGLRQGAGDESLIVSLQIQQ
ncbi:MAG: transglutaminase domain-containing protein [Arenibacterium sp.]